MILMVAPTLRNAATTASCTAASLAPRVLTAAGAAREAIDRHVPQLVEDLRDLAARHGAPAKDTALTAASTAALTLYDMIKAVDKHAEIGGIRVLAKSGGKSGGWTREDAQP